MMAIGLAIVLAGLALAFVLFPLYRRSPVEQSARLIIASASTESTDTASVSEREQAARSALQEVELDYQLGNITTADYAALRERYMRRALLALKSRHDREQEIDAEIEEQLRQMKENHEKAASE